jgi:hypothetical protein
MTMGHSLTQPARPAPGITAEDRMERIGQLTARQREDALLWLAGYAPAVSDAVTSAVEPFPGDGSDDPAPFCGHCGADIGVFLKFGLDWRHYKATTFDDIELFDPGHAPVLAWRIHAPAAA